MPLSLFNTLSRKNEIFQPMDSSVVGLYTCGPTVYNYLHVGNYRTYIFEDVLKRTLKHLGYSVRHVMNITDVGHLTSQGDEGEDKVEVQAAREGKTAWGIARFYEATFIADIAKLDIDFHPEPVKKTMKGTREAGDILCRATDHITEQIELIERLEKNHLTYKTSDGIYYDTAKFNHYGALIGKAHLEGIQAGARVETNPEKNHQTDFALWKFSPKNHQRQMEWDSPWGKGFPGWHIECSAMAMKYLGESFDIHCGGVDHIPIHHTNEIAQSEGATKKTFVRYWLHGEFLLMNKAKMAKSAGGFVRLQDLTDKGFDPLDFRYLCLTAHYRKQLDFSWDSLSAAQVARRRLKQHAEALQFEKATEAPRHFSDQFQKHLSDDLNAPAAMAVLWDSLKENVSPGERKALLELSEKVFALGLFDKKEEADSIASPEQQQLLDQRALARKNKDFAAADVLRKQLAEHGWDPLESTCRHASLSIL